MRIMSDDEIEDLYIRSLKADAVGSAVAQRGRGLLATLLSKSS